MGALGGTRWEVVRRRRRRRLSRGGGALEGFWWELEAAWEMGRRRGEGDAWVGGGDGEGELDGEREDGKRRILVGMEDGKGRKGDE